MHTRTRPSLYEQLAALPEGVTGEILGGQLYAHPRPSARHGLAATSLADELVSPFQKGRGGPGGWWIIVEPELHFVYNTEVGVPDLAGWRRERMPRLPEDHRFTVVPDWVCEILSKSTASLDREIKMPDLRPLRCRLRLAGRSAGAHPRGLCPRRRRVAADRPLHGSAARLRCALRCRDLRPR